MLVISFLFSPPSCGLVFRQCFDPGRGRIAVKNGRFTEEKIAYALHQAETGTSVAEVIRKIGMRACTQQVG